MKIKINDYVDTTIISYTIEEPLDDLSVVPVDLLMPIFEYIKNHCVNMDSFYIKDSYFSTFYDADRVNTYADLCL